MIVCPRCSKENQDHYMFCLGCGTELKGGAKAAAKPAAAGKPAGAKAEPAAEAGGTSVGTRAAVSGSGAASVARGSAAPATFGGAAAAAPQPESFTCPRCSATVPRSFRFCGSCGFDMTSVQAAAAAAPAEAPVHDLPAGPARLVLIRPDGSEGDIVPIGDGLVVGRESGGCFAGDSYLSPKHAKIARGATSYTIEDLGSLNGVYLRIERDVPHVLANGAIFRIGQEIIRFETLAPAKSGPHGEEIMGSPNPGFIGRISLVIGRDTYGNAYPIPAEGMHLGRERGDIIFPDDGYVSGLHCRLHAAGGQVMLTDVGSSNGTFVRITKPVGLAMGSLVLLGQQLFRIEA